jgi:hypothetical protein
MKALLSLAAALALLATTQAFGQSAGSAASYDWGQSQVQKLYASPYARPSDAAAATADRKRLTESRAAEDEEKQAKTTATTRKPSASGKLACLGAGSTINSTRCNPGDSSGFSLLPSQQLAH